MEFLTNLEGNFFTQDRRRQPLTWVTCTGVGDIDSPTGEPTAQYCPDPLSSGQFKLEGFTKVGGAQAGTYSLVRPLLAAYNYLLHLDCDFVGRVNWVGRGIRQDPRNYEIAVIMMDSNHRRKGIVSPVAGPASGTPESTRTDTNADIIFSDLLTIYRMTWQQIEVDNTSNALSVNFLAKRCESSKWPGRDQCAEGLMGLVGPGAYAYEGEVKKSFDGVNWAATPTDPYTWGGDTGAVLLFETPDGVRWCVFRREAVVGAPAEVGISEDYGVTWQNVTIGNVHGQYVMDAIMVGGDIMAICDDGFIYRSRDQGESWALMDDDAGAALNALCFFDNKYGYAVGDGNTFVRTTGGSGGNWETVTGPAAGVDLLSCSVNDRGHFFVGTDDARLFRSEDRGTTWEEWMDLGGGTIDWIGFDPKASYVGLMLYNPPDPASDRGYAYRSEDGGATWRRMPGIPTNNGLNAGFMCDENFYYVVGDAVGGNTFVTATEIA